jgi:RNA polymerase sigma-70 factor (ECF subfamily)
MSSREQQTSDFVGRMMAVQPRMRAYVRMMIYNPSDVNDILQEVAAVGWQKYGQFDPTRSFDAWVMGIVRNCVLEYMREQGKRACPLSNEAIELLESEAVEASSSASHLDDALENCLGKLAADDHLLVRTRFETTETNRSAAKRLGMSESKVSRALNRIYAQLLLCIKQQQRTLGARS